jgi:cell wall-associated NlpC family hydrolase
VKYLTGIIALALAGSAFGQSATTGRTVLGKLGQAIKETAITAKPGGKVYYRVKPYEYLVLRTSDKSGTYKVLLQNGKDGYVSSDAVAKLPYDVTAPKPSVSSRSSTFASRSSGTSSLTSRTRAGVAQYSLNFTGTPYVWGGNDPNKGIDCSGFVKYLYGQIGVSLPRTAREQVNYGVAVTRLEDLQPGDRLYFWSKSRNMIGHTGIYLGNGYFCHATSSKGQVTTDYLGTKHWLSQLVAARR